MRTCTGDTTESDLSSLELESLRADLGQEEQLRCDVDVADSSSSGGSVDARSSTPLAVVRVISVDKTCVLVHPRSGLGDAAEGRKVGVAARFVAVSTPCPSRPKSSDATAGRSRHSGHRGSRTSTITHPQSSTSSSSTSSSSWSWSSSSSSSGSVPDGYSRVARCLQPAVTSERDEQRLIANCLQLDDSQFYVAELSSTDAKRRLRCCTSGTFLVRDSAHPRHLYSLTVRTQRGITSIRTVYDVDGFRLDSDPEQAWSMPSFNSVVALVSHYVDEARTAAQSGGRRRSSCVFVDRAGRRDLPVVLNTPYRSRPGSLRHLCRLTVNAALDGRDADRLCLVPSLRDYLKQHPFSV